MNVWAIVGISTLLFFGGGTLAGYAIHSLIEERWSKRVGIPLVLLGVVIGMSWIPTIMSLS